MRTFVVLGMIVGLLLGEAAGIAEARRLRSVSGTRVRCGQFIPSFEFGGLTGGGLAGWVLGLLYLSRRRKLDRVWDSQYPTA